MNEKEIRAEKYALADVLEHGVGIAADGSYTEALKRAYLAGTNDKPKLMTIEEVAELFRFKKQSIYNMVHENRIPYIKVGNAVRFKEEDIKELLKCVEAK